MLRSNKNSEYISGNRLIYIFLLIVVFLVALLLRIYQLGSDPPGLYADEIDFMLNAYNTLHGGILNSFVITAFGKFNWGGFVWITADGYTLSILLFKTSAFAARFPVALYGSLIVFPIFMLTRELTNSKFTSLVASSLWALTPLAVVMSRVGYGVEIFPLFLYLFYLVFLVKFMRNGGWVNALFASALLLLILYLQTTRVWAGIPSLAVLLYLIIIKGMDRWKTIGWKASGFPLGFGAIILVIAAIWAFLGYGPHMLPRIGQSDLFGPVYPSTLVTYLPFQKGLSIFLSEMGYALSPSKLFWLSEFTSSGFKTSGPGVPFMLVFLAPFFYYSIFILPFRIRRNKQGIYDYYLLIALLIFGLITPAFFYIVPPPDFETGEGIFALPPMLILSSIAIQRLVDWIRKEQYRQGEKWRLQRSISKLKMADNKRTLLAVSMAVVLIGSASINVAVFSENFYVLYPQYVENNQTQGMWYGWQEVSSILVGTGLYKIPIFYTPGVEGGYNLSNSNNFRYWFSAQGYPLYWLYSFSGGKITSVGAIYYDNLPNLSIAKEVVISQNPNYTEILSKANVPYQVIYTILRPDGTFSMQIIIVTPKTG